MATKTPSRAAGQKTSKALTPEVLGPEETAAQLERQYVEQESGGLLSFFQGIAAFFVEAAAIERRANEILVAARALRAPTSGAEDAQIQTFIRDANSHQATTEAKWGICQKISALHRRLTAARARATGPVDQAKTIAQRLHNEWIDAERRRAAAEQQRLQREEEERAREARQRELDELEAKAVQAEEESADLSEREQQFVAQVVSGGRTYQEAAKFAGFKNPIVTAARLISLAKIQTAFATAREAKALREQANAKREAPLETRAVEVQTDIIKAGVDRTTWSGDLLDEEALVAALLDPRTRTQLGIPTDLVVISRPKLNEHARALHELINKWPGVRAVKNTRTV